MARCSSSISSMRCASARARPATRRFKRIGRKKTMKTAISSPLRLGVGLLALLGPALAFAQAPDKGDTAWMLTSTALVLLMSVPALALFYGGLVRSKNMLSVLMQVFVSFSLITVLWCVYGYSFAFTTDRKSTRLNSSHSQISYAVFCLKKKKKNYVAALICDYVCLYCMYVL